MEVKVSSSWRTWNRNRDVLSFHWNSSRSFGQKTTCMSYTEATLKNIPFQKMRDWSGCWEHREHTNTWPLAVSPAWGTLIPQQLAEHQKGQGFLQCQLKTCFLLRTQQVITERRRIFLGTMPSKEFLTLHHDTASLKGEKNKAMLNRRHTDRDSDTLATSGVEPSQEDMLCSAMCTLEDDDFSKQQRPFWKHIYVI